MRKTPNITITLLLTALLVVSLSFVFPKNKEKYLGEMFWTRKTFATDKYNVVLMGDSRVYRGLSPEIMEIFLPDLNILNFAYSNGGLNPTMFKAAEAKLTKKHDIKIIVLGITTNAITAYTKNNEQYFQELSRPREEVLERRFLNPLRYWFSSTSPEALIQHFSPVEHTSYYLNEYHMNGYVESDKFPIDTMEAIPSYTDDFTNFKVDEQYLKNLFSQVKKWSDNGILVVAYRPPVSQAMKLLEDTLGRYNEDEISEGIISAGGNWIELNNTKFNTYDGSHLDKNSAELLSEIVGFEIKKLIK